MLPPSISTFRACFCFAAGLPLVAAVLAGCHASGPDPFESYGKALNEVRQAALPEDWRPEAVLVLGDAMLQTAFSRAADMTLAELPDKLEVSFMAATIRLFPRIHRTRSRIEATGACASCLVATIGVRGDTVLEISNPTGRMTRTLPWTGTLQAVYHLHTVQEVRGDVSIVAAPAEEDQWEVDLKFEKLDPAYATPLLDPVRDHLRRLVSSGKRFSIQLARIEDDSMLALRALRVRPVPGGIALDQAFMVVDPDHVEEALPDPGDGWAAWVPAGTLLALVKAAVYQAPPPEDGRLEPVALSLEDGRFVLDLNIHPNRWPHKPILLRATGAIGINANNTLGLVSLDARPVKERFANPLKVLLRARIKDQIDNALAASIPVSAERDMGPGSARVIITEVTCDDDRMVIRGKMEVVGGAERGEEGPVPGSAAMESGEGGREPGGEDLR